MRSLPKRGERVAVALAEVLAPEGEFAGAEAHSKSLIGFGVQLAEAMAPRRGSPLKPYAISVVNVNVRPEDTSAGR